MSPADWGESLARQSSHGGHHKLSALADVLRLALNDAFLLGAVAHATLSIQCSMGAVATFGHDFLGAFMGQLSWRE